MKGRRTGTMGRQAGVGYGKVLTPPELKQMWRYLRGDSRSVVTGRYIESDTVPIRRLVLMLDIMTCTGLRKRELVKLRLQDTPYSLGVDAIDVYKGKNQKDRSIPISNRLACDICAYIKDVRPQTLPRWVGRGDIRKPVFYSRDKRPYYITGSDNKVVVSASVYRTIRRVGRDAGFTKPLHPHMLRHTFAVTNLLAGVDLYSIGRWLGHSSITTTTKYLHLMAGFMPEIGEKLDHAHG